MSRLNEENLISIFTKENYTVLNIYKKNNKHYVDFICPYNHKGSITYDGFKRNRRCGICYKEKNYTYEKVKEILGQDEYQILDDIFINVKTALKCLCPKGHICNIYLTHWLKGHRCRECGYLISAEKNRSKNPDREFLKEKQKIAKSLRSNLKRLAEKLHIGKKENFVSLQRYTTEELHNHIKNHKNYLDASKNNNLSIDHIFPIKAFDDFGLLNLENAWLINGLDNLQPLDRTENSRKNCQYNKEKFIIFLKEKGIF
jgi:hypothetical protein